MPLPVGVECVLAPNPSLLTGPGTNTFVVASQVGLCVVIDPGPDIPAHLARVAETARGHGALQAILVTHGHPDHAEGAATLRRLTGAPVLAWSREGTPATDIHLADNARIAVGERRLRALHTPGHRFDHLCFLLEDADTLFVGDLVAGVGTVVIAPPEGDLVEYLASLRRLLDLNPGRMLPAHGPPIEEPRALLEHYIEHRAERERQVLAVLARGPATVEALVADIYAEVDVSLLPIAAYSVLAHLLKLEREGRVAREVGADGGCHNRWRLP
ncbi:MAG: MBL fold metallo-hydrolase [Ktedonobacterales bacterium]|nr:MBL fold metallo-hydrolase [Ktedonobacterales bacterium]